MKIHPNNIKFSHLYRRLLYRVAGGVVLLLTTTGRKTGKLHTVGLQYELIDGLYYVAAADGLRADWLRNIRVNPEVAVQATVLSCRNQNPTLLVPSSLARSTAHRCPP